VDLIAESGGRWIFIGMESLDPANLADVNKSFNKPAEYADVLNRLAQRNVYAITSFIFGLDNDTPGVADRTLSEMSNWPPGLPVFGLLTPFPATPLYERLEKENRLTRPKHWLDFAPFRMAHTPLKMSGDQAQAEVRHAWSASYSPAATRRAIDSIHSEPVGYRIGHLVARIFFRGIYFPQTTTWSWLRVIAQNRRSILHLIREAFANWHRTARKTQPEPSPIVQGTDKPVLRHKSVAAPLPILATSLSYRRIGGQRNRGPVSSETSR
jgi:hypothetical protein